MSELIFREKLLEVRVLLGREYQPYARLLAPEARPKTDWLHIELLPALVLLPSCFSDAANPSDVKLAAAMEISFLAGRVHDLAAAKALSRSILCGDYLYAAAGMLLSHAGYDSWLGRIGQALCRRSEGKLAELGWDGRAYVPPEERVRVLRKQNAEGFALAAEISAADLRQPAREAWSEFGYYVGILQAMQLLGLVGASFDTEYDKAFGQADSALKNLPWELAEAAARHILEGLRLQRQAKPQAGGIHRVGIHE